MAALELHWSFPDSVQLSAEEIQRIQTAQLCLLLHKTPEELEKCDPQGLYEILEYDILVKKREAAEIRRSAR